MLEKIETEIKKILEVVKICPTNLQEKCFEVLLTNTLLGQEKKMDSVKDGLPKPEAAQDEDPEVGDDKHVNQQEIKLTDLHLKAKKLLDQGISIEEINNIFYKESGEYKPVFDDLKSSKMSESQIKLALIEALRNAIQTGEFKFNTEFIRQQCDTYKCFDSANFASNFKKQKELFNEEYKMGVYITLSPEGKKELVKVIKQLAN